MRVLLISAGKVHVRRHGKLAAGSTGTAIHMDTSLHQFVIQILDLD